MKPGEAAGLLFRCTTWDEFLQAVSHTLMETNAVMQLSFAMRNNSISDGGQLHSKAKKGAFLPQEQTRGACAHTPARQASGVMLRFLSPGTK